MIVRLKDKDDKDKDVFIDQKTKNAKYEIYMNSKHIHYVNLSECGKY